MFLSVYQWSKCLGNVWWKRDQKRIENRNFMRKNAKTKNQKNCTCQGGTTVRPCGTSVRVFTWLGGTTVCLVGTVVPASLCPKTPIFSCFFLVLLSIPMDPKHLNLIKWSVIGLLCVVYHSFKLGMIWLWKMIKKETMLEQNVFNITLWVLMITRY